MKILFKLILLSLVAHSLKSCTLFSLPYACLDVMLFKSLRGRREGVCSHLKRFPAEKCHLLLGNGGLRAFLGGVYFLPPQTVVSVMFEVVLRTLKLFQIFMFCLPGLIWSLYGNHATTNIGCQVLESISNYVLFLPP